MPDLCIFQGSIFRFTDQIKYQGEELTDDMKKELDNRLWNTEW